MLHKNKTRARPLALAIGSLLLSAGTTHAAPPDVVQVQTPLSGSGSAAQETNAGNLLADAVRETGHADIGLVPADEIADATVPAGSIPVTKLATLLRRPDDPDDTVVVLKITGAQVLHALELGLGHAPRPFPGFWQVSGLQVRYDPAQPEGKRVSLAGVGGGEVSAGKTYTVATSRAVALGSLGYFRVWDKKDIAQNTGIPVAQSVAAYAAAHKTIHSAVEGRITAAH